jgi:predicted dehydrogenase
MIMANVANHGFGIVGCGMISEFQAKAIKELKNGELKAVFSRSEANAKRVGEMFGVDWYTDCRRLLDRKDIDVISVCTPSGAHMEYTVEAAKAGKHVVVEKPLEITLERIDNIIKTCRENEVRLCTIFPSRFHAVSQLIKRTIASGRFGRLTLGDAYVKWWRSQEYYDKGGWKGSRKLDGGGALMNQSIHAIDLLQWFMGDVDSILGVSATLAHERIEVEDTAVACLRFKNGALGVIEGATSVFPGFMKKLEILGDRGSVVIQEEDILTWHFADESPDDERIRREFGGRTKTGGGAADPRAIGHEAHRKQFDDFLKAIDENREPLVNGEEGRKAVEIILGIYKSASEGRIVKLPL